MLRKGVVGKPHGKGLRAGNSRWLGVPSHPIVQPTVSICVTIFCFMISNAQVAVLGLQDILRPDASATMTKLQNRGINVHMLPGNGHGAIQLVAAQLNVLESGMPSSCSPEDNYAYIKHLSTTPLLNPEGKT